MALFLGNSCILHIPKTGGYWIRQCLEHNNIPYRRTYRRPCTGGQCLINRAESSHCIPYEDVDWERVPYKLAFVRHPLSWYRSYWAYRVMHKNVNPMLYWRASDIGKFDQGYCILDEWTHNDDFQTWIDKVIEQFPEGVYSWGVKAYVDECTDVGYAENLAQDFALYMQRKEGVKLDTDVPRSNATEKAYKELAVYRKDQEKRICEIEHWIIDNFYEPDTRGNPNMEPWLIRSSQ